MAAIIKLRKTAYYVEDADGRGYHDADGHGWFSKEIAQEAARACGGMYYDGNRTSIKEVVIGYEPGTCPGGC